MSNSELLKAFGGHIIILLFYINKDLGTWPEILRFTLNGYKTSYTYIYEDLLNTTRSYLLIS